MVFGTLSACWAPVSEVQCRLEGSVRSSTAARSSTIAAAGENLLWVWCDDAACHGELQTEFGPKLWERSLGAAPDGGVAGRPRPAAAVTSAGMVFVGVLTPRGPGSGRVEVEALSLSDGVRRSTAGWELIEQDLRMLFTAHQEGFLVARDFNVVGEGLDQPYGQFDVLDESLVKAGWLFYPDNTTLSPAAMSGVESTLVVAFDRRVVRRVRFSPTPKPEDLDAAAEVIVSSSALERLASSRDARLVAGATEKDVVLSNGVRLEGPVASLAIDSFGPAGILATGTSEGVQLWAVPGSGAVPQRIGAVERASAPALVVTSPGSFVLAFQADGESHLQRYACSGLE
ncbi:MAG: hypothetical protein AMXMBFR34_27050 [Myxococcaceae bacterium]